jgi:hypothetical protein
MVMFSILLPYLLGVASQPPFLLLLILYQQGEDLSSLFGNIFCYFLWGLVTSFPACITIILLTTDI